MRNKIISINRDNLYDIAEKINQLSDIEDGIVKVFWFDAKKNELLEPNNVIERFPEQVFPIRIVKYGKVYYVSSVDELKPLPPNQREQLEVLIRSLLPKDALVNISA